MPSPALNGDTRGPEEQERSVFPAEYMVPASGQDPGSALLGAAAGKEAGLQEGPAVARYMAHKEAGPR